MSVLSVIQSVAPLLGIARPAVALASTDITIQQLCAILQEEGDELARRHDWGALKTPLPGTFTGDGTTLAFAFPANFHRLPNGPIFWRRDRSYMPLSGPMSDMEWRGLQAVNGNEAQISKVAEENQKLKAAFEDAMRQMEIMKAQMAELQEFAEEKTAPAPAKAAAGK